MNERLDYLYHRYTEALATTEEVEEFFELLKTEAEGEQFRQLLSTTWDAFAPVHEKAQTPVRRIPVYQRIGFRIAVAASFILLIGTTIWMINRERNTAQPMAKDKVIPADIAPGGDKAILTLADGKTILLDSAANGKLSEQAGALVTKENGRVIYNKDQTPLTTGNPQTAYNTITVPRKGKYQLVLADGTKVWLDAESSLRFPTAFTGPERVVELTGQGYFEVAHNAKMPFRVIGRGFEVQDIGTAFNINAYGDGGVVTTTLVEGSARVVSTGNQQSAVLIKGQEASINDNASLATHDGADIEQALAWKNGLFNFKASGIREIMNQVVRWYDVEVRYEGEQKIRLSGYVSRDVPLSQTLELLQSNGVHFKREGNKIIMLP